MFDFIDLAYRAFVERVFSMDATLVDGFLVLIAQHIYCLTFGFNKGVQSLVGNSALSRRLDGSKGMAMISFRVFQFGAQ
jgi:hypothetical protein